MSEQGQTPPPREPSSNEPQAAQPAPDQATTPLPAEAPATPGQQPAPEQPPAATAAQPPVPPPPPPAAVPVGPGRGRRFVRHRATQLVAVGLLGLVLGGGIVGAVAANRFDDRGGPGHGRMYERGERGPDRGNDRGGDRFDQRGPFGDRGDRFER